MFTLRGLRWPIFSSEDDMIDLKCSRYCSWTTVNFSAKVDVLSSSGSGGGRSCSGNN